MENENKEETPIVESETTENTTDPIYTPEVDERNSELEAKNKQLFERAKKAEADAKAFKSENENLRKASTKSLDVGDYIDISASLEGLDQREKEFLAREHKLTGRPLTEIRKSEDFQLWDSAYRQKTEKEKLNLTPSNKQPDDNSPISLEEALNNASSVQEKEEILRDNIGYSIDNKPRADRVIIGR